MGAGRDFAGWLATSRVRARLVVAWLSACCVLLGVASARAAEEFPQSALPLCDIASSVTPDAASVPNAPSEAAPSEDCGGAMCDPSAASVVGEPSVPLADDGRLEELPCEAWVHWVALELGTSIDPLASGVAPPGESPTPSLVDSRADGAKALGSTVTISPFDVPPAVLSPGAPGIRPQPGYSRLPYRPPLDARRRARS